MSKIDTEQLKNAIKKYNIWLLLFSILKKYLKMSKNVEKYFLIC